FCGLWQGLAAGLVLWLNPTILMDAYAWPTWDAWIVPFFLLTALAASLEWWFVAGITLGIGAMFKGQQLAIAPGLAAWALVVGGPRAMLVVASGTFAAIGAIVSPWTLTFIPADVLATLRQTQASRSFFNWPSDLFAVARSVDWPAIGWVVGLGTSVLIAAMARWWTFVKSASASASAPDIGEALMPDDRPRMRTKVAFIAGAALLVFIAAAWPWCLSRNRENWEWGGGAAMAAGLLSIWPWRGNLWRVCGVVGAALITAPFLFSGSTAWWTCAFHFGTAQFPYMVFGPASNLPALFELKFGWPAPVDTIAFNINSAAFNSGTLEVTTKSLFNGCYAVLLVCSGIAIGIHARRRDRRVLPAIVLPWLLFFMLTVSLHERYLLFAAATAAICCGYSVGMASLGLLLSIASAAMTIHQMFGSNDRVAEWGARLAEAFPRWVSPAIGGVIQRGVVNAYPGMAWGLLLILAVFSYVVFWPTRWRLR
ncbi:MAG: hypothetical protein JWM57_2604, partial [Phycisphaerales bacterium]|nr:hypothetical protein [Phycisphaerales bacterium]